MARRRGFLVETAPLHPSKDPIVGADPGEALEYGVEVLAVPRRHLDRYRIPLVLSRRLAIATARRSTDPSSCTEWVSPGREKTFRTSSAMGTEGQVAHVQSFDHVGTPEKLSIPGVSDG